MLIVKPFICNPFQVNAYLLYSREGDAVLIDPAFQTADEFAVFDNHLSSAGLDLKLILATHGHVDHLMGLAAIKGKYKVPFKMHEDDAFLVEDAVNHAMMFGLEVEQPPLPDGYLVEGETVSVGKDELQCLWVPGHSPGSLVFYHSGGNFLVAGDVLFNGSIGRSDLPRGNHDQLIAGIRSKLFVLPDETQVLPGHGEPTTIGDEKHGNPFFQ